MSNKNQDNDDTQRKLLYHAIEAFGKSLDEPSPENDDAAYKLLEELKEMWSKSQPFDWDTYNQVSERLDRLEIYDANVPDSLIQTAIKAGECYFSNPSEKNGVKFDKLYTQIMQWEHQDTLNRRGHHTE